jgi:uncharacterized protein (DUF885 family)
MPAWIALVALTQLSLGAVQHPQHDLSAVPGSHSAAAADTVRAALVTELADRYVAAFVEFFPEQAEFAGLAGAPHDRFTDNSLGATRRWQRIEDSLAAALAPVEAADLNGTPALVTFGYLRSALNTGRATRVCRTELWPVNNLWGWQASLAQMAGLQPVGTPETRAAALARWRGLPRYVRTEIANLREGVRRGYTAPAAVVRGVIEQLDGLLAAQTDSLPFMDPAHRDSTAAFQAAWRGVIQDSLRAAAKAYRTFLTREYLPRARPSPAVSRLPNGMACYRALLHQATSIDREPTTLWREVNAQVARDTAELLRVAAEVYPPSSTDTVDLGWLRRQLEADEGNRLPSPDSVKAFTLAAMSRVRAALPRWFATVPTSDVVLTPFPDYQQPTAPEGQYLAGAEDGSRPATYLYRTHQPVRRVGLEATVFHETWPGHHLQSATIAEQRERHPITRLIWVSGFAEGWAAYSELLAEEMGVYGSARDRLGAYMSFAPLMAVDLGLQTRGWTEAKARRYLERHAPNLPRERIASLVALLAGVPGYVASYAVGGLEFHRLRRHAQQALGSRFDIRVFHRVVLEDGAVPLPLLADKVSSWIAAERAKVPSTDSSGRRVP